MPECATRLLGEPLEADVASEYDELVQKSSQGSIYCQRWWLDAVAPEQYTILTVRERDQLIAAWPITAREERAGWDIIMPPLTQKLGILFRPSNARYAEALSQEHDLCTRLIRSLPSFVRFNQRFHETFTNWLPFHWTGFEQTTRYTYVLDDISTSTALWSEMRSQVRNKIRKAEKAGIALDPDVALGEFLDLHDLVFKRQGIPVPVPRETIYRLDETLSSMSRRRILGARDSHGRLHAGAYIVWDNGVAYYIMGGSDPSLRKSGAHTLVLWQAIVSSADIASAFDFEGSMLQSVESVCRGFGGKQRPFFAIRKDTQPWVSTGEILGLLLDKVTHRVSFRPRS